jgi:hypothetical protein
MPRFGYALSATIAKSKLYVHQIGSEQERFLSFYSREVLPRLREGVPA